MIGRSAPKAGQRFLSAPRPKAERPVAMHPVPEMARMIHRAAVLRDERWAVAELK
jgi:hypothetical protein